jgi:hypothetical protein
MPGLGGVKADSSNFFGLEEENYSHAFGINSAEQIVGDLELPDHTQHAMVLNRTQARDTDGLSQRGQSHK